MGGSSGGGSGTTVTNQTAIPDWQQGQVQANEQTATALSAQPYPTYSGQLIAGFTPQQTQGMTMAQNASTAQAPDLTAAEGLAGAAPGAASPYYAQAASQIQAATQPWNAQTAAQYMSPYAQSALAPQIQALGIQQQQNANQIGSQATMAGAFGDAQYGNEQALNNLYANQSLNQLEQTGMNSAYNTGLQAFGQQQQAGLQGASQSANIGSSLATNDLNAASAYGSLGQAQQSTGIAGANAVFNAGTQQQQLNQSQLTEAYQNFMNQANYPYQQLNAQIAATANSPYQVPTANLAPSNATAANLGAFSSALGGLGSLLGGSGSTGSIYGGLSSDRRLKKNIKKIGKLLNGLGWYSFNYLWSDQPREGVMSDEVRNIMPEAVSVDGHGFDVVDYDRVFANG
jgi:hypothetical protein